MSLRLACYKDLVLFVPSVSPNYDIGSFVLRSL